MRKHINIFFVALALLLTESLPIFALDIDMVPIPNQNYEMLRTEVIQELYTEVMGKNPSSFQPNIEKLPVESVSWFDAIRFCNKLSEMEGLEPVYKKRGATVTQNTSANGYRLPTVEEWEYAAKGGEDYIFAGSNAIDEIAWFHDNYWRGDNATLKTHPVAQKKANGYGLYDMSGNVWEWCWDERPYNNAYRLVCGGSWDHDLEDCKISGEGDWYRATDRDDCVGFRIVRNIK